MISKREVPSRAFPMTIGARIAPSSGDLCQLAAILAIAGYGEIGMRGFRRQRDTDDHQKQGGRHIECYGPWRVVGQYQLCRDNRRGRVAEDTGELEAERRACKSHAGM